MAIRVSSTCRVNVIGKGLTPADAVQNAQNNLLREIVNIPGAKPMGYVLPQVPSTTPATSADKYLTKLDIVRMLGEFSKGGFDANSLMVRKQFAENWAETNKRQFA